MNGIWDVIKIIIPGAIAYTMPILMGALGGLYSERSGVTNLCIEGLMLFGCFASAATIVKLQALGMNYTLTIVCGICVAMLASMALSYLHALASIKLKADQTISGTAINMLSTALSLFLAQTITGSGNITIVRGIIRNNIPILSKIPVVQASVRSGAIYSNPYPIEAQRPRIHINGRPNGEKSVNVTKPIYSL